MNISKIKKKIKNSSIKESIVIGTSIAPQNMDKQILAVNSWINNGFRVISCNVHEEIEAIKPHFEGIEIDFVEVENSFNFSGNTPLPYIDDILTIVGRKTKQICGFINSDIYIENMSEKVYEYICKETKNCLVIVRRNEINDISDIKDLNWKKHNGIDMFLIDKKLISEFCGDEFFVQSSWDTYILLKAHMCGIQIKELMNPIAFHKRHSQKWNFEIINIPIENFWYKYFGTKEKAREEAQQRHDHILLECCKQICYLEDDYKCLFVVKTNDTVVLNKIKEQECLPSSITIQVSDADQEKFDFVFYMLSDTLVSSVFCKTVIFIMTCCECSELEIGSFFISKINGVYQYNNLNMNIGLLEHIHEQSKKNILAVNKKGGMHKKVIYPIAYKFIDIYNKNVFRQLKLEGKYYIAPAGERANWWYNDHGYKLKSMVFLGFLDNMKKGTDTNGKIYPMETLHEDTDVYVIVASKHYFNEITYQVSEIINEDRIINEGYICYVSEEGVLYYFDLDKYKKQ